MATCEWVIDIIQEWVQNQGYLTASYVDEGDPLAPQFITPGFIKDGTWRDMNLSLIVPEGAVAAHLGIHVKANAIGINVGFRKKGNVNSANAVIITTQVANLDIVGEGIVTVDANRFIQYNVPAQVTAIDVVIRGWWL